MIDLIFNILNLLVFVFLLGYGFYKYILPSLKTSFYQHKLNLINLARKKDDLVNAQQDVSNKIVDQDKLCIELKDKIDKWKQNIDNLILHKQKSYTKLKNKLYEKINKQSGNYQYEQLKKNITAKLIENLTKSLNQHFKKEENTEVYFANIFKELK